MNKTELRSRLSKVYGVKLSPEDFKNASVAELQAMVDIEAKKINDKILNANNNEGDVNMNNNNNGMVTVNMDEMIAKMQAIMNVGSKFVVGKVNNHTTKVGEILKDTINTRMDSLEAKLDKLTESLQKPAKNPELSNKQYNKLGSTLKPLGTVINPKNGQEVNYFGVCSDCGEKITSPDTVAWGMLNNNNKIVCYSCQKKARGTSSNNTNRQAKNPLEKCCPYCNTKVVYKDANNMVVNAKKAIALGLKPYLCKPCAVKLVNGQTPAPDNTQDNTSFVPENQGDNNGQFGQPVGDDKNIGF